MNLLEQPRIENYKGSNIEKAGILNVTCDDLPSEYSKEYRENIIRKANELYHLGIMKKIEFADILDSITGQSNIDEPIEQDENGNIILDEKLFYKKKDNSISLVHNHTNNTFYSDNDITTLVKRNCIKDIFLASNGRLLRLAKSDKISYTIGESSIFMEIYKIAMDTKNAGYVFADCSDDYFLDIKAIFSKYGLEIERW